MTFARPIFVASLPRSGSSMVAGLLAGHGVWVGTCREADDHNPKGYFESVGMSDLLRETVGHGVNRGHVPEPPDGWEEMVRAMLVRDGYTGGPWLWKASALYWRLMLPLDPHWVVVHRPLTEVQSSGRASGIYGARQRSVTAHHRAIEALKARGAIVVASNDIIRGRYWALEQVLARVGLSFDRRLADEFVDPTLWHHGAA